MKTSTLAGLAERVADPSAPLVTYYDLDSGERVELSATTVANWVAKTSNYLVDEADATIGTRIRIGLPTHWLRCVWVLAAWHVGATVADERADIGVSGPDLEADEPLRLASALLPFGARFRPPPPELLERGFVDLGAEIPGHGDVFVPLDPPGPGTLALDLDGRPATHADLLAEVAPEPARLLVTPGPLARDAYLLLGALLGGGSLVLVAGGDPAGDGGAARERVAVQEQATPASPEV